MVEPPHGQNRCPTTHWTQIYLATQPDQERGQNALDGLLRRYRPVLICHTRHRFGVSHDQSEEWVHDFIALRIMQKRLLAEADQSRGRFRTFLFTALDNFIRDQLHKRSAVKRGGNRDIVSLASLEEDDMPTAFHHRSDPGDVAWARSVIDQAIERMRIECDQKGRADLWKTFEGRVLQPLLREVAQVPYDVLVSHCGFSSPAQASDALITAKRMFERAVRDVVIEYAKDKGELMAEINELRAILNGGREL